MAQTKTAAAQIPGRTVLGLNSVPEIDIWVYIHEGLISKELLEITWLQTGPPRRVAATTCLPVLLIGRIEGDNGRKQ